MASILLRIILGAVFACFDEPGIASVQFCCYGYTGTDHFPRDRSLVGMVGIVILVSIGLIQCCRHPEVGQVGGGVLILSFFLHLGNTG